MRGDIKTLSVQLTISVKMPNCIVITDFDIYFEEPEVQYLTPTSPYEDQHKTVTSAEHTLRYPPGH